MGRRGLAGTLALLIVACVAALDCTHSASKPKNDGSLDHQPTEGGATDTPKTCSSDGTHNKDNGLSCSCDDQCKSNFCVDGVCCDKACTGTCLSCARPMTLGMCTPVTAGDPPRAATDCVAAASSTCGLDGLCDGAGKCERYQTDTVCQAGTCDGDGVVGTYRCDGQGGCKLGASTVCAPFSCDPSTSDCFHKCSVDGDCVMGQKCVNGSCGKSSNGAFCDSDDRCASGHCADSVCCNTACDQACRTCTLAGHVGTCSATPEGKTHPMCGKEDPSTCGSAGVCDGFGTCTKYPANTVCGPATCSGNTLETAQTCDGLGTCGAPVAEDCGTYRCTDGACTSSCKTASECADGHACDANGSCGPKVDGQSCKADAECANQHCVDGVCCESACQGSCRSCALPNLAGRCTLITFGAADPRAMCTDTGATSCGTDGKCDSGNCRKYAVGTVCANESCTNDVHTNPSTCNASGQCIKPTASACYPYHCNADKCFSACTNGTQCIAPNICGQNGNISSCGPKPIAADCSADNECGSMHCAQGKCCDMACTDACSSCNLPASLGTCSDVQSGADPQGKCKATAQSGCGTTGMCAAGNCAQFSSSTVCKAASCVAGGPPSPAVTPQSKCDGKGTCVTPSNASCAPGRCDTTALMCVNTCMTSADCTSPNTCVNGSCGLIAKGGTCSTTIQCAAGLTCNHDKVCCDKACDGVCETCKPASGTAGTCTAVAAGLADPAMMCVATTSSSCGTNGKCGGASHGTLAACQDYDISTACGTQSCRDSATPGVASIQTLVSTCSGSGTCSTAPTRNCGLYKCLDANQCGTSCTDDTDCVGSTCNTVTHVCGGNGTKQGQGQTCNTVADCVSTFANCVDGVCCDTACGGACHSCKLGGIQNGVCSTVTAGTPDALCPAPVPPNICGNTGQCAAGGTCAKISGTQCRAPSCSDPLSKIAATTCNGGDSCPAAPLPSPCGAPSCNSNVETRAATCSGAGVCATGVMKACAPFTCDATNIACLLMCATDADCTNGKKCDVAAGSCTGRPDGKMCSANADCANLHCADGVCCNTACGTTCHACNVLGSVGTCSPVTLDTPDGACTNPSGNVCGNTSKCDSGGMCAKADNTQSCGAPPPTCVGSTLTTAAGMCNGSGGCSQPSGPCPNNLICDTPTTCFATCLTDPMDPMSTDDTRCASGACQSDGTCM